MSNKSFAYAITVVTILGVLPSAFSTGVATGSGWGTAQVIETESEGGWNYHGPQLSVDGCGNAIAVWDRGGNIWSNRYVAGTSWGTAQLIETSSGGADYPQVSVDSSGNAIAIWSQNDGVRNNIWSNRYAVGTGWGTAQLIETNDSGDAEDPQVSMDSYGNAIAVWSQSCGFDVYGDDFSIWSNRYVVGTVWGTAQLVETEGLGRAYNSQFPQVSVDGSGNAIVVWYQDTVVSPASIWSKRYVAGTGWETAQLIETSDSTYAAQPQVSVDNSGNAIAVWQQEDGVRYSIWSNRYAAGTGWETAQLIETGSGGAELPQVSMDGSGNAIVVWYQSDGVRDNIWSNRYVVGTGWGTAELIETNDSAGAFCPQVSADISGNANAVWEQGNTVWSNRYVVGTGWGTAQSIGVGSSGADSPQVSADDSGNAIVVWRDGSGDPTIWSNRYSISDTTPPMLSLTSPSDGMTTETPNITVSGMTEAYVALKINGVLVALEPDGSFAYELSLVRGTNVILITATDAGNNSASVSRTVTCLSSTGVVQVGVKSGDWIRLDYKISGAPSGTPLPTWIKLEFLSVEGTSATVRVTMHMSDGTEQNASAPIDIVGGGEALGLSGFVIPANCTTGDSIYVSGYGNTTITGETKRTYAGARRTVVYASISQYETQLTFYWDKETGVMVEASTTSGAMTGTAKATETNMWTPDSSGLLANPTVVFVLAIGAVMIVIAVAFLVVRRKKGPDQTIAKEEEPPTAPPET